MSVLRGAFRLSVVVALVVVSQGGPAIAQTTLLGLAMCKLIKDDTARLKCFDEAFSGTREPANSKEEVPVGWTFTEDKSPIDDSPQISATLIGEKLSSKLIARCEERKTELAIVPKDYLGGVADGIKVLLRIADAPAVTEIWNASSSRRGAFSPSPVALLTVLPDNAALFVRLTGYNNEQHDAKFALGPVSEVRQKISHTCKWTDPKLSAQPKPASPPTPAKSR